MSPVELFTWLCSGGGGDGRSGSGSGSQNVADPVCTIQQQQHDQQEQEQQGAALESAPASRAQQQQQQQPAVMGLQRPPAPGEGATTDVHMHGGEDEGDESNPDADESEGGDDEGSGGQGQRARGPAPFARVHEELTAGDESLLEAVLSIVPYRCAVGLLAGARCL